MPFETAPKKERDDLAKEEEKHADVKAGRSAGLNQAEPGLHAERNMINVFFFLSLYMEASLIWFPQPR